VLGRVVSLLSSFYIIQKQQGFYVSPLGQENASEGGSLKVPARITRLLRFEGRKAASKETETRRNV